MSYAPTTDFLALLRDLGSGMRTERMPGLDFVISALARAGFVTLSVSSTAPVANQSTTAWFLPASPSWTGEGALYLWNAGASAYQLATPALWQAYFLPLTSGYVFQSLNNTGLAIATGTTLAAVQRASPAATTIVLPNLAAQFAAAKKLQIVDFSTAVTAHAITLTVPDGATIMGRATWGLLSTADQLAGVMLQPSPDLNSWIIAP